MYRARFTRFFRGASAAAGLIAFLATAPAVAQLADILSGKPLAGEAKGPLPGAAGGPESVVTVVAELSPAGNGQPLQLSVTAQIAPPWYTYSLTQKPTAASPTVITLEPSPDYQLAGDFRPNLPPTIHQELGATLEEHAGEVTWTAPLEIRPGVDPKTLKVRGKARIQVCRKGECLQPTSFAFVAQVAAADEIAVPKTTGVFAPPNGHAAIKGYLDRASAAPGSTVNLVFVANPADKWHVYELSARDSGDLGNKPTLIVLTNTSGLSSQPTTADAKVIQVPSEIPNLPPQRYYGGRVTWNTPIQIPRDAKPGNYTVSGLVGYQVCSGSSCDLPRGLRFEGSFSVGAVAGTGAVPLALSEAKYAEAAKAAAARPPAQAAASLTYAGGEFSSIWMVIAASLVGGFILNFMPCVLPVIGLKILSFAEQAGRSRAQIFALNLWYSLGVLSVFMVLATFAAGVSLGLREQNLGWGEQFSSTSFNVVMVAVVFVMSLSFLGVWEIPIPGFVGSGTATEVAAKEGAVGAFAKGALTTVLATPCSGPLLGSVFGFTLNQPPAMTYMIFGLIGLGMSAPYLLIGAFPHWIRFLPKPGAWMDTFKHMMGFVMLGTIVFVFSFMKQEYIVPTFAFMIGLWAGCWWIGRTSLVEPLPRQLKAWAIGASVAAAVGVASFTWLTPHESVIPWKPFSQAELARLSAEGKTVLVDFTANWCATCKANLFFAIETNEVRDLIEQNKVVPLLADWTDGSPEIKAALESLKSNSIPLLAIFPADKSQGTIVLRDVLTKQNVLNALKKAGPSQTGGNQKELAATN